MRDQPVLKSRDWSAVQHQYWLNSDYPYVVIDEVLTEDAFGGLRDGLLDHWGWRFKNATARRLFLIEPRDLGLVWSIAKCFLASMPAVFEGLDVVTLFAVMHQESVPLGVHADNSRVSVNLWLTPDKHNLNPDSGGLILFRQARDPSDLLHEYNDERFAARKLTDNDWEQARTVTYRCNRATIFQGATLHATQPVEFRNDSAETFRLNLTLLFGKPDEYNAQREPYARVMR